MPETRNRHAPEVPLRSPLGAMLACAGIYGLTVGLSTPLVSLILETRGVHSSVNGMVAASAALGVFASSPFIPFLISRLGMQTLLVTTLLLDAAMFILLGVFHSVPAWFLIRMVMGGASNIVFVISETWVNASTPDNMRGRVMGAYLAVITGSIACGPLLIQFTGLVGWQPFLYGAGLILLAGMPVGWLKPRVPDAAGVSSFGVMSFLLVAPMICAGVLLHAFKELTVLALLPVYSLRSGFDVYTSALTVTVMGVGSLLLQYPVGWLADRFNRQRVMIGCGILGGIGTLLLPCVIKNSPAFWIFLLLWGGAFSGIYTAALTLLGQYFHGLELATANATIGVLWGAGSLLGPGLTGVAMEIMDPGGFVLVLAIACVAFVLFTALRRARGHAY